MKKNIAVIGAGQLGSRHLQSLAALNQETYSVTVFDTQEASLKIAKERYEAVNQDSSPTPIFTNHFNEIPSELFVAIIATSSGVRRKVVENLLDTCEVKYLILEKFLFPEIADYQAVRERINQKHVTTYVNTPRRAFDFYRSIQNILKQPFHMEVTGSQWGLGCNTIHFLDLFYFLNHGTKLEVNSELDDEIIPSKRAGYIEFTGSFYIRDAKNNTCHITSFKDGVLPASIAITDSEGRYIFHESMGEKWSYVKENGKYTYQKETIRAPFQSESTSKLILDLEKTGQCHIAPYEESAYLHIKLLEKYLEHYSKYTKEKQESCPIT